MKKYLGLFLLLAAFCISASAQKVPKPTLTASESTEAQSQIINEGIRLSSEKKYEEAIKKYEEVLKENPDNAAAIFEAASAYAAQGDKAKALELAMKGAQYKSKMLARFYLTIANLWDEQGNLTGATELYQDTIKLSEKDGAYAASLPSAYFGLGVALAKQKQFEKSRQMLKRSVELDFNLSGASYYLAEVYLGTKYKVPALLAASRLLSLETNTPRAKRAAVIILNILRSAKKDETTGSVNILLDLNAAKDEGDFGMYELFLGISGVKDEKDKNKTDQESFAESFDSLIGILEDDKNLKKVFVGKTYIPFLAETKKKGYSKTLAYLVLQQSGDKEAEKWFSENKEKLAEFASFAKAFQPQK